MALEIQLKKQLGEFALDIEFQSKSRRIGILGASGCGKSMTLKCIAGIETPDEGRVIMDGHTFFDSAAKLKIKPQKRKVGYLFQNYALFPTMTVRDNVAAGLGGYKKNKIRVDEMIRKFRLEGLEKYLPGELSGGQQQRVALARIMAYEPDVILLDEPFSALDEFLKERLQQELLEMLSDYQGTVVLVSHSRDEIYRFSEELLILDRGKMVSQGRTKEVFANPKTREAARLTGCKNIVSVQYKNAHELEIPAWGISLYMKEKLKPSISHIGIRAHDFVPIWEEKEEAGYNYLPVRIKSIAHLPFENRYYLWGKEKTGEEICWFVQRELWKTLEKKGMPKYLKIPEEKVLLLT